MLPSHPWLDQSRCFDSAIYDSGWSALIRDLLDAIGRELKDSHARLEIRQIKEKLGKLRMYYSLRGGTRLQEQAVAAAYAASERRSAITCIECGAPGRIRTLTGWIAPFCDRHA